MMIRGLVVRGACDTYSDGGDDLRIHAVRSWKKLIWKQRLDATLPEPSMRIRSEAKYHPLCCRSRHMNTDQSLLWRLGTRLIRGDMLPDLDDLLCVAVHETAPELCRMIRHPREVLHDSVQSYDRRCGEAGRDADAGIDRGRY